MKPTAQDAACDFCTRRFAGLWVFRCASFRFLFRHENGRNHLVDIPEQPVGACLDCVRFVFEGNAAGLTRHALQFLGSSAETVGRDGIVARYHSETLRHRTTEPHFWLASDRMPSARFYEWACPNCGEAMAFDTSTWINDHTSGNCPRCGLHYDLYGKPEARAAKA